MPDPVTGGIVGATTLISAGLSSSAASKASKAQQKGAEAAAAAQVEAAKIAAETTKEMYYQGREDVAPWRTAGVMALEKLLGPGVSGELIAPKREDYLTTKAIPGGVTNITKYAADEMLRKGEIAQPEYDQILYAMRVPGKSWGSRKWKYEPLTSYTPTRTIETFDEAAYQEALANYNREKEVRAAGSGLLGEGAEIGLETSPGYQWRLSEGAKTLENAAVGKKLSPSTAKAMTRYGQEFASSEYDKLINRYYSLAGLGQTSAGQMATGALTTGSNLANLQVGAGQAQGLAALQAANARASGYMNQANIWGGALGSASDIYLLSQMGAFNKAGTA